jgi:hypothetical protein
MKKIVIVVLIFTLSCYLTNKYYIKIFGVRLKIIDMKSGVQLQTILQKI